VKPNKEIKHIVKENEKLRDKVARLEEDCDGKRCNSKSSESSEDEKIWSKSDREASEYEDGDSHERHFSRGK